MGLRTPNIYMGGLVGHPDPNVHPGGLDDTGLMNLMYELACQLGSATDPVVKGSMAAAIFGRQVASIQERYYRCADECRKRGLKVYSPDDTRSTAEGDRLWRERVVAARRARKAAR